MRRQRDVIAPAGGALGAWSRFWFTPSDPFGLHVVRVATGVLMTFWLLTLATEAGSFFSLGGWFDRAAHLEASRLADGAPQPASWSLLYLCGDSAAAFQVAYWASLLILVLFTLGVAPRVTALLAWLIASSFTASPAFDDEVEALFSLLTLYLAFGYLLAGPWHGVSWAERLLGPWRTFLFARGQGASGPSVAANVALRLLQIHLCVLVVASGLHKLQAAAWWSGVALWYPLHRPLEVTQEETTGLAGARTYLLWLNVMGYATLFWQLAFPAFAWRPNRWRVVLLGGGLLGWIGLGSVYRMPLFGATFLAACLAYVTAQEWQLVRGLVAVWSARSSRRAQTAPVEEEMADVAGGR